MLSAVEFFDPFSAGSVTHGLVLLALIAGAIAVIKIGRGARRAPQSTSFTRSTDPCAVTTTDRVLAGGLLLLWAYLETHNLTPGRFRWDRSLPLHVCDVVGLAAPLALFTGHRLARTMVFFWGFGLTSQAFITPTLFKGPSTFAFWAFWSAHAAILWTAAYEFAVRRYRPAWNDYRQIVLVGLVYSLLILPINVRLGVNYGYMGPTNFCQTALVKALGPWPARLPKLLLIVWTGMALMALPWAGLRLHRRRHGDGDPRPLSKPTPVTLINPKPARAA